MSMSEAKQTLGFPPTYDPSPTEIQKAYKRKAIENHPDLGGDPKKMVAINVAKEILEGKRREDRTPFTPDPEAAERAEMERKRARALQVIAREKKEVSQAIDMVKDELDITNGKLDIRQFLLDDYAEALDVILDSIDNSPELKKTPNWRKAEALCHSLSTKALRIGKKSQALMKLQGQLAADILGFDKGVSMNSLATSYAEVRKFMAGFETLWSDSRKLVGLYNTSEDVPYQEWDDAYWTSHNIIDAFHGDFSRFSGTGLKRYQDAMRNALKNIGDVMLEVAPSAWQKAPSADAWAYPNDFDWAAEVVQEIGKKTAHSYGR